MVITTRIETAVNSRLTPAGCTFKSGNKPKEESVVVVCDCGNRNIVTVKNLRTTMSCGCLQRERASTLNTRHGHAGKRRRDMSATYSRWTGMLDRVRAKPGTKNHRDYVSRGITVCDRWLTFEKFLEDMGECPPRFTLDRINNDGNYEPSNCRWANYKTQARNKRTNRIVEYCGKQMAMTEACERAGVKAHAVYSRLRKGYTFTEALIDIKEFTGRQ